MTISMLTSIIISMVCPLIAMAFFTLLERKGLGYFQTRKGPNKTSIMGLPQPLADALKLFTKEWAAPTLSNLLLFSLFPMMALILAVTLWALYPHPFSNYFMLFGVMFFLCVSSINVYTILGSGWASNSKYALLGALRGIAQTISYEVSMALTLLCFLLILKSFSLTTILSKSVPLAMLLFLPVSFMWLITCLAETNRAPFDFAEGESELVSGFNTEYSAGNFALIFMAEYTNILFLSLFSTVILISPSTSTLLHSPLMLAMTAIFSFWFVWMRATLPRMRYDRLMSLTWKIFLPLSLTSLLLFIPMTFL
uniref:NADH dehydrogenase subunit 1 n=1 Tax=Pseudopotamilla reniformis TaxID=279639 RepID=UPI001FAFB26F|nr:NADH dehydrogenase subunit 1 [Pseudopotamilla reniformis]ULD67140.1 NADH dehydrogenase subunit 1 [Pseudopotamilla reniformis]